MSVEKLPSVRANGWKAEMWQHEASGMFTALQAYAKARIEELTEEVLSLSPTVPREVTVARIDELRKLMTKPVQRTPVPGDNTRY